jgi:ribosomal protein L11 methylase PrmA
MLEAPHRDRGSFRDPSGYVFFQNGSVYRTINPAAAESFGTVAASGVLAELASRNLILPFEDLDMASGAFDAFKGARGEIPVRIIRHPRIKLISYPYEWVFSQLQDAALAHLDIQIAALDRNVVLSDATPYNMQFHEGKVVHIDLLSFRPYREGEPWAGYNQFCRMFLLPLLIEAWAGAPFQPLLRGRLDGVTFDEALAYLPRRKLYTSLNGYMHVKLQASMAQRSSSSDGQPGAKATALPKARYRAILSEMRHWIASLKSGRRSATYWRDYAKINSYSDAMKVAKLDFVREWAAKAKPAMVWDIGGNTGDYSLSALSGGAKSAAVLDSDLDSLEVCYRREKTAPILPLVMNLADPSPSLGWAQAERKGLAERDKPDGILALAVIHHMCISSNLPLEEVVRWFVGLAPSGVIEFVPKRDPMVKGLLRDRDDIFLDYDEAHFRRYLGPLAKITEERSFEENGRLLVAYNKVS